MLKNAKTGVYVREKYSELELFGVDALKYDKGRGKEQDRRSFLESFLFATGGQVD